MSNDDDFILKLINDLKRFRIKIGGLQTQLLTFQTVTIKRLADEIIVSEIHQRMRDASFSEKIIEGTTLDKIEIINSKKIRLFFRSEYFSDTGFDVALAREEGTDSHDVIAGEGKVLPIQTDEGIIFRKKSKPSGIPDLFIVRDTVQQFTQTLQNEFIRQQSLWFEKNMQGVTFAS